MNKTFLLVIVLLALAQQSQSWHDLTSYDPTPGSYPADQLCTYIPSLGLKKLVQFQVTHNISAQFQAQPIVLRVADCIHGGFRLIHCGQGVSLHTLAALSASLRISVLGYFHGQASVTYKLRVLGIVVFQRTVVVVGLYQKQTFQVSAGSLRYELLEQGADSALYHNAYILPSGANLDASLAVLSHVNIHNPGTVFYSAVYLCLAATADFDIYWLTVGPACNILTGCAQGHFPRLTIQVNGCGNGVVEVGTWGEQCDDGNINNGDGCDCECQNE